MTSVTVCGCIVLLVCVWEGGAGVLCVLVSGTNSSGY